MGPCGLVSTFVGCGGGSCVSLRIVQVFRVKWGAFTFRDSHYSTALPTPLQAHARKNARHPQKAALTTNRNAFTLDHLFIFSFPYNLTDTM
jgi:hypothetical protein